MTAHTIRLKRKANGAKCGHMLRVMASLDPEDFKRLKWIADRRQVPIARVIRDAVWAYVLPIKTEADAENAAARAKRPT